MRRYADAESEFKNAEEISPGNVNSFAALAYVYALEGKKSEAERMLPEVKARVMKAGHPSMVCLVYTGLDHKDEAIRWLQKAYEQRDFYYLNLEGPNWMDPLRSDPRFQDLERRLQSAQQMQVPE